MLRKTFFNYKIKIKTTTTTGLKNEVKHYPMSYSRAKPTDNQSL